MCVRSPGGEDPLEKGMAAHSDTLACRIPWTEEPGRPQCIGSQSQTCLKRLCTHTICLGSIMVNPHFCSLRLFWLLGPLHFSIILEPSCQFFIHIKPGWNFDWIFADSVDQLRGEMRSLQYLFLEFFFY